MKSTLLVFALMVSVSANAADFHEVEPNNTPATANNVAGLLNGNSIFGSLSNGDTDYFNVSYASVPFGIYRKSATMIPLGPRVFVEGQEFSHQSFSDPDPVWYSFGNASPIQFQVSYNGTYVDPYQCQFYINPITPIDLGTFQPGNFRFQEVNSQLDFGALDFQIFDSQGRIVPGGWNTNIYPTFFDFSKQFSAGTYYALAGVDMRSEAGGGSIGNVMGGTLGVEPLLATWSIQMTTPTSSVNIDAGQRLSTGIDSVIAYSFTVVPEPASLLALGAGLAMLGRKRWRR